MISPKARSRRNKLVDAIIRWETYLRQKKKKNRAKQSKTIQKQKQKTRVVFRSYEILMARSMERPLWWRKDWIRRDPFPSRWVVTLRRWVVFWSYGSSKYCIFVNDTITVRMLWSTSSPALSMVSFISSVLFFDLSFADITIPVVALFCKPNVMIFCYFHKKNTNILNL